jgi:RNA polymerase sigma-70 factor, ECF subfamily
MSRHDRDLLGAYIDRFNARDFDAIRRMIAEDVRLELVGRTQMRGRTEVSRYFGNYASRVDWELSLGFIDRRPAVLVRKPGDPAGSLAHFVLLGFESLEIMTIRDYRYATHVTAEVEVVFCNSLLEEDD